MAGAQCSSLTRASLLPLAASSWAKESTSSCCNCCLRLSARTPAAKLRSGRTKTAVSLAAPGKNQVRVRAAGSSQSEQSKKEGQLQQGRPEADKKRQNDLRRQDLTEREMELFGEPDGTSGNFEEQSETMKKLIRAGEWLIKVTEGEDENKQVFDKGLIVFLLVWCIVIAITAGFIELPFYNVQDSSFDFSKLSS